MIRVGTRAAATEVVGVRALSRVFGASIFLLAPGPPGQDRKAVPTTIVELAAGGDCGALVRCQAETLVTSADFLAQKVRGQDEARTAFEAVKTAGHPARLLVVVAAKDVRQAHFEVVCRGEAGVAQHAGQGGVVNRLAVQDDRGAESLVGVEDVVGEAVLAKQLGVGRLRAHVDLAEGDDPQAGEAV